jgi:iron complex outermembrane receptor protein
MSRIAQHIAPILLASTCLTANPAWAQAVEPSSVEVAQAQATEAEAEAQAAGTDIIVTGTREAGVQAADSATPIQVLGSEALSRVGQPNLNQALTQLVPSFTAQTQGTDMASFSLSARLRGVSPNHTLVMVNGKRRHGSSILQVINGPFGGSAAPSIDLIPPDAVQRIEILQDGSAAQYGSDAIAGVINIILKSNAEGGSVETSVGQYYDGEGRIFSVSGNLGYRVGEAGFINLTLFHRRNDYTTIGKGQITAVNLNGTTNTTVSPAFRPIYDALNARQGTSEINGGQPKSDLNIAFYNAGYDFGDVQFYSFGDISRRHGRALQGYRPPNRICRVTADPATCYAPTVQNGMVPLIEVITDEFSVSNGFRGDAQGWNWDFGVTYAEEISDVLTTNSANASLFTATGFTPRDFYDGSFKFTQLTNTVDVNKEFDVGVENPLTFAFGGEYRRETYRITAGDEASRFVEGGQSFPGYALSDATTLKREAASAYGNVILKPVTQWTVDLAGRYERYSDFGDTVIGKATTRYDFSPAFALRATASTGFRAPSLAESGYSATNVAPTSAVVQLAPSSPGAVSAGFGALRPEKSINVSLGTVVRPMPKLIVTLDGYYIKIRDRIVSSGTIRGQNAQPFPTPGVRVLTPLINGLTPYMLVQNAIQASGKSLDPTVLQSGDLSIQTFTNGIATRTWGLEFAARYPVQLGFGRLDLSVGANYNDTKVTNSRLGTLFNLQAEAIIEQSSPRFKSVLSALFTSGSFSANVRATSYSQAVALVQPNAFSTTPRPIGNPANGFYEGVVKGTTIFDLELGYDLTKFINIAAGANNLFDKIPEIPALVADYNSSAPAAGWLAGRSPYINGSGSIDSPYTHGPYGSNGGYYYARVSFAF